MKKLFYLKYLFLVTTIFVITAVMISKTDGKEMGENVMNCEYIEIYYTSPVIMPYVPITKEDIETRALSRIIIGDEAKIKEINETLSNGLLKKKNSKGIADSLTFKIVMKFTNEKNKIWVVDKSQNFELDNIYQGKMPYEIFEKLVHIFDSCVKVADLKYLEYIKNEGKIQIK